jgi:hypothetical protein
MKTTINQARHEANIAAKAANLFASGYTFKALNAAAGLYAVAAPVSARRTDGNGHPMPPYIVDTIERTCSCQGHRDFGLCSHRLAVEDEEARVAWAEAEWEAEQAARGELSAF